MSRVLLRPTQLSEQTFLDLERIHEFASHHVGLHQHQSSLQLLCYLTMTACTLVLLPLGHDLVWHQLCVPLMVSRWRRVHFIAHVHVQSELL